MGPVIPFSHRMLWRVPLATVVILTPSSSVQRAASSPAVPADDNATLASPLSTSCLVPPPSVLPLPAQGTSLVPPVESPDVRLLTTEPPPLPNHTAIPEPSMILLLLGGLCLSLLARRRSPAS